MPNNLKKLGDCLLFNKPVDQANLIPTNQACLITLKNLTIKRLLFADNADGEENRINREGVLNITCGEQTSTIHWETDNRGLLIEREGLKNSVLYFGPVDGLLPLRVAMLETNDPEIEALQRGGQTLSTLAALLGFVPGVGGVLSAVVGLFSKLFTNNSQSKRASSTEILYEGLLNFNNEPNQLAAGKYHLIRHEKDKPGQPEVTLVLDAVAYALPIPDDGSADDAANSEDHLVVAVTEVKLNLDETFDSHQFSLEVTAGRGEGTQSLTLDLPISAKELGRYTRKTGWIDWVADLDHAVVYQGDWQNGLPIDVAVNVASTEKWKAVEALTGGLGDVVKAQTSYRYRKVPEVIEAKVKRVDQIAKALDSIRKTALQYFANKVGAERQMIAALASSETEDFKKQFADMLLVKADQTQNQWFELKDLTLTLLHRKPIKSGDQKGMLGKAVNAGQVTLTLKGMRRPKPPKTT